jgi:hypothetical protein
MRQLGIVTYQFKSGCLSSTKRKGEKTAAVAKTSPCGSMPSLPSHKRVQSSLQIVPPSRENPDLLEPHPPLVLNQRRLVQNVLAKKTHGEVTRIC